MAWTAVEHQDTLLSLLLALPVALGAVLRGYRPRRLLFGLHAHTPSSRNTNWLRCFTCLFFGRAFLPSLGPQLQDRLAGTPRAIPLPGRPERDPCRLHSPFPLRLRLQSPVESRRSAPFPVFATSHHSGSIDEKQTVSELLRLLCLSALNACATFASRKPRLSQS
jgi:hypothetical protein